LTVLSSDKNICRGRSKRLKGTVAVFLSDTYPSVGTSILSIESNKSLV
jgi:hypothetical protein